MIEVLGTWVQQSGIWAYVLAPLFTVFVAVVPIPAEIPALLNGMVFGPLWGTLVTWLGALSGAQISFELARRYGRPLGQRVVTERILARADAFVDCAGWPTLLLLRLIPTIAFTGLNWASGFTAMRRRTFVWTTAVGILPGAILFTAAGAGVVAMLEASPYRFWVYVGMLLLTLFAVIFYCVRRKCA